MAKFIARFMSNLIKLEMIPPTIYASPKYAVRICTNETIVKSVTKVATMVATTLAQFFPFHRPLPIKIPNIPNTIKIIPPKNPSVPKIGIVFLKNPPITSKSIPKIILKTAPM